LKLQKLESIYIKLAENGSINSFDSQKSDSWLKILNSSAAFLSVKFIVGTISTVLLYSVFYAPTILLIKQISLMQQLPSVFSFGIKNKVHDDVIAGGNQLSLFSNLIAVKLAAYLAAFIFIFLAREVVASIEIGFELLILSMALVGLAVCNDVFYSICFSRGKLTYLINLMTLKTFSIPLVFYLFGEKHQIHAWLWGMLFFEILQAIILYFYGVRNLSVFAKRAVDISKIINLLSRSFVYDLNMRAGLIFEIFLFFFFVIQMDVFQAALLSFLLRVTQTLVKIVGQTIQKKFIFDIIDLTSRGDREGVNIRRMNQLISNYFGFCFFVLFGVTISFAGATYFFIEKFSGYAALLAFCLPLSLIGLANITLLRIVLCQDARRHMLVAFTGNLIIYLCAAFFISRFGINALDVLFVMNCMACVRYCVYYYLCSRSIGSHLAVSVHSVIFVYSTAMVFALHGIVFRGDPVVAIGTELVVMLVASGLALLYFGPKCMEFVRSVYFAKE
jgi:hypothetical protein